MNLLLDTHALLWFFDADERMPALVQITILEADNACLVSLASMWELAIKISRRRLNMALPFPDGLIEAMKQHQMLLHPIDIENMRILLRLPWHHRDSFDRLLIAQAMRDNLFVVGKDAAFDAYGVRRIWA